MNEYGKNLKLAREAAALNGYKKIEYFLNNNCEEVIKFLERGSNLCEEVLEKMNKNLVFEILQYGHQRVNTFWDYRGAHILCNPLPPDWVHAQSGWEKYVKDKMSKEDIFSILYAAKKGDKDAWEAVKYLSGCRRNRRGELYYEPPKYWSINNCIEISYDLQPDNPEGNLVVWRVYENRDFRVDYHYHK